MGTIVPIRRSACFFAHGACAVGNGQNAQGIRDMVRPIVFGTRGRNFRQLTVQWSAGHSMVMGMSEKAKFLGRQTNMSIQERGLLEEIDIDIGKCDIDDI